MPGADYHNTGADMPKTSEDDRYSLSTTGEGEIEGTGPPGETTRLLGAGTRDPYETTDSDPQADAPSRTDSWVGYKEYEHLPWHKRPSVCSPPGLRRI